MPFLWNGTASELESEEEEEGTIVLHTFHIVFMSSFKSILFSVLFSYFFRFYSFISGLFCFIYFYTILFIFILELLRELSSKCLV